MLQDSVPYEEVPKEIVGEVEKTGHGLDHLTLYSILLAIRGSFPKLFAVKLEFEFNLYF